jgi:hypothetical protein
MLSAMKHRTLERCAPWLFVATLLAVGGVPTTGCDGESLPEDQLCQSGENIFCRCPGGDPGTKACNDSGDAFGECGPCTERPSNGPAAQGSGGFGLSPSVGGSTSGPGGAGGGGPVGTLALLEPCETDGECASGVCRFNFCTIACGAVSECPYPKSECVKFDETMTICMPTCQTAVDCVLYEAPPSKCGFTRAVDNWGVTVCANWGDAHQLKPDGTDCLPFDHKACNLGYQQMQSVCTEQGICAVGCYVNNDCPDGQECSSQGTLGNCQ